MSAEKIGGVTYTNDDVKEQAKLQQQAQEFALQMFALQQQAHKDNQEITTKANIEKANHDAMMNMANNIK
ncbi:MAG TPA: hypothetical protein VGV38_15860, partial [Pyrinomonadaceae bacterium]|nr:hypothetical protein [Pyrinomonadaceae bacterium]